MTASKFQTQVARPAYPWWTGYGRRHLFLGSCFTENVGRRMAELKLSTLVNPFGILYNPESIARSLEMLLENRQFGVDDLFSHDGLWHSAHHHGRFSGIDRDKVLDTINAELAEAADCLTGADFLFLTFGTAWVYQDKASEQVVANCHKLPHDRFRRIRLSVDDIVERYVVLLERLWLINADAKVIFTISPIRHWKDGAVANQQSKATLILAVDRILQAVPREKADYFPAYEIVMDELRDYRFYAEDMLHLSDAAVNHIWSIFCQALLDDDCLAIMPKMQKVLKAMAHKPLHPGSEGFRRFAESLARDIRALGAHFPETDLLGEMNRLMDEYLLEEDDAV